MPGFERAATIDRPPAQVYAVLDDIHAARHWMPAIRRIEVLTPDRAVDVGFRWRETRAILGIFRMSAELEIAEHVPPRRWGLKYEDKKMRAAATFELAPTGLSGTLITLREDVQSLQDKPKRAQRMAKWMEKADDDLLLRLKAYVESQPVRAPRPAVHEASEPTVIHEAEASLGWSAPADRTAVTPPTSVKKPIKKPAKKPAKAATKKKAR